MRLLFEIDKKDYNENGTFFIRPSVRGIIFKNKKIAMIHSLKYDYYKFPGGGAEQGENHFDTLIREIREETGLIVIPSTIREYGLVHRVQKGKDSDIFIQDNFYYFCEAEDIILSQQLEADEEEEKFVLEFVTPDYAIEVNNTHSHSSKDESPRFIGRLERDTRVLELLIKEFDIQ